ncbi:HD-GYP domain-containing protein [Candidatus Omnitrophota bacterium]
MDQDPKLMLVRQNFFKTSTLIILLMLIVFQFIAFQYSFTTKIVPDGVSLLIMFACVFYLWMSERLDRERLLKMNLELILAQNEIKESQINIIMSLALSQEAKDTYTQGHSRRVTKYAVELAKILGLTNEEIAIIERAGKLHDIGKIGICDDILLSKEKLSSEQYSVIKGHPLKSASILDPLKFLDREKAIILHHHERYDGTGYPDGLRGDQIPLGSRILALVDAFDAMKSKRPYKKEQSKAEILEEIKNNAGSQFDPEVVRAFFSISEHFFVESS